MAKNTFYITTPIYYPNARPHLGTLYSTLLADIFARWQRSLGREVFFVTGLDEHGQKIEEAAQKQGIVPQAFVDKMAPAFLARWEQYSLHYDKFIRTSNPQHEQAVIKFFEKLIASGHIYKATYAEYYCVACETTLDSNNANEEIKLCSSCNRPVQALREENYFFKLSAYQDALLRFYSDHPDFITPASRYNEVLAFVKSGLKDLSISRATVKWGVPFPADDSHTIYVWCDALLNYLSAVGYGADAQMLEKWWPADLQVMGKDIIRFHAVYWPAMLLAAGVVPPKKLLVHGYILAQNQKMSKSLGNAIDPEDLLAKFGSDAVRYYLAKYMAVTHDGSFSVQELQTCFNADLANNFGNLVSRLATLVSKQGKAFTQESLSIMDNYACQQFKVLVEKQITNFTQAMDEYAPHLAATQAMSLCNIINTFIHEQKPWGLLKTDSKLAAETLFCASQALYAAAILLQSFIPEKIKEVFTALGVTKEQQTFVAMREALWRRALQLQVPAQPIFPRLEEDQAQADSQNLSPSPAAAVVTKAQQPVNTLDADQLGVIKFEELQKVKLAVGEILTAEPVRGSSKLLRLVVSFGALGERQVISGIAEHYHAEQIINLKAIFVLNLAERKIMGLVSQAMILVAKDDEHFTVVTPADNKVAAGTLLS